MNKSELITTLSVKTESSKKSAETNLDALSRKAFKDIINKWI